MRYSIQYESEKNNKYPQNTAKDRQKGYCFLAGLLILAALFVGAWHKDAIISWIVPGDDQVTIEAAEELIGNLQEGTAVGEAFTVFCDRIIDNAQ